MRHGACSESMRQTLVGARTIVKDVNRCGCDSRQSSWSNENFGINGPDRLPMSLQGLHEFLPVFETAAYGYPIKRFGIIRQFRFALVTPAAKNFLDAPKLPIILEQRLTIYLRQDAAVGSTL